MNQDLVDAFTHFGRGRLFLECRQVRPFPRGSLLTAGAPDSPAICLLAEFAFLALDPTVNIDVEFWKPILPLLVGIQTLYMAAYGNGAPASVDEYVLRGCSPRAPTPPASERTG